ncbi:MAG: hypothetical protein K2F94_03460 [Muribaculaceae bacterium]|nr:hypothetical protein [Muribaculaceae bacterium]MDE6400052.1 hypothetical protein [Muribaculaceae bacterium]MDE6532550.1 hypothetical protein [Muribaculaceae bacterium]
MEMENNQDIQLQKYEEVGRKSDNQSRELKLMVAGVASKAILANAGQIIQGYRELQALAIQSNTYLTQLSMKYAHNSEKFKELIRGAERRLDRQLEDLSEMRRALLLMSPSSSNQEEIKNQRALLEMIAMAQDSFNREIDRLYDL